MSWGKVICQAVIIGVIVGVTSAITFIVFVGFLISEALS